MDTIRALLAAASGLAAGAAVFALLGLAGEAMGANASGQLAASVHGARGGLCALAAGACMMGAAWIYTRWFDALLGGPAAVRGGKFGVITWLWTTAVFAMLRQFSALPIALEHPYRAALGLLGACLAFGTTLGLVYGSGRRYDDYQYGLAYGLPDRRSLG